MKLCGTCTLALSLQSPKHWVPNAFRLHDLMQPECMQPYAFRLHDPSNFPHALQLMYFLAIKRQWMIHATKAEVYLTKPLLSLTLLLDLDA